MFENQYRVEHVLGKNDTSTLFTGMRIKDELKVIIKQTLIKAGLERKPEENYPPHLSGGVTQNTRAIDQFFEHESIITVFKNLEDSNEIDGFLERMEMKYMVGRTVDIWRASLREACMDPLDERGKMMDAEIHDDLRIYDTDEIYWSDEEDEDDSDDMDPVMKLEAEARNDILTKREGKVIDKYKVARSICIPTKGKSQDTNLSNLTRVGRGKISKILTSCQLKNKKEVKKACLTAIQQYTPGYQSELQQDGKDKAIATVPPENLKFDTSLDGEFHVEFVDASSGDIFDAPSDVIGREAFHYDEDISDPSRNVDEETFKPVDIEDDAVELKLKELKELLTNIINTPITPIELLCIKQTSVDLKELKQWANKLNNGLHDELHDEHLSVDDFNSPTTKQSSYKLLQVSIFLLISLFKRILNLLCDRLRISKGSAYKHLVVIIRAQLSTDIEKNPGPIHERCYRAALNFCENASDINLDYLKNHVSNFLTTDEDYPEGFLCDDNVMIWLKVMNILDRINYQDKQLFDDIISLQRSWENSLSEEERAERAKLAELAESSQCKCKIHGSSCPSMNGSPNMVTHKELQTESVILPALRAPVAAISTPSPEVSSPSPAVSSPSPAVSSPSPEVSTPSPAVSTPSPAASSLSPAVSTSSPTLPHQPLIENAATLKEETIEIFNTDVATGEFFKYGRFSGAKHGKFICQTDCEISPNRQIDPVKHQGISRESLINHARKYHSIKLDFQKKKAFFGEGSIKCSICDKSYTKKQARKNHLAKSHQHISRNDPTLQATFPSSHTFTHSATPSGVPIPVTIQTPYPDMSSQTYQANNVQLVQLSTQYETVDQDTLMDFLETFPSSSGGVFSQESNQAQSQVLYTNVDIQTPTPQTF